jgi:uncharacterized protein YpiB (UPF0302 family)
MTICDMVFIKTDDIYRCFKSDVIGMKNSTLTQKELDLLYKSSLSRKKIMIVEDKTFNILKKNFTTNEEKELVNSLILDAKESYEERLRLIDKALEEGDKELFLKLTNF